jgi:type III secretory pathway component EscV
MKSNVEFRNKNLRGAKIEDFIFWLHELEENYLQKAESAEDSDIKSLYLSKASNYGDIKQKMVLDFDYTFSQVQPEERMIEVRIGTSLIPAAHLFLTKEIKKLRNSLFQNGGITIPTIHLMDDTTLSNHAFSLTFDGCTPVLNEVPKEGDAASFIISELIALIQSNIVASVPSTCTHFFVN